MALLKTLLGAAALSAPVIAEAKAMHVSNLHSWLAAHASGSSSRTTMSVSGSSSHSGSGGCPEQYQVCVEGGEKFFGFSTPQDSSKPDGIKVFEDGRCEVQEYAAGYDGYFTTMSSGGSDPGLHEAVKQMIGGSVEDQKCFFKALRKLAQPENHGESVKDEEKDREGRHANIGKISSACSQLIEVSCGDDEPPSNMLESWLEEEHSEEPADDEETPEETPEESPEHEETLEHEEAPEATPEHDETPEYEQTDDWAPEEQEAPPRSPHAKHASRTHTVSSVHAHSEDGEHGEQTESSVSSTDDEEHSSSSTTVTSSEEEGSTGSGPASASASSHRMRKVLGASASARAYSSSGRGRYSSFTSVSGEKPATAHARA